MKTIALLLYSPTPYWDDVIEQISMSYDVSVFYEKSFDSDKNWKELNCHKGYIYSRFKFFQMLRRLNKFDLVIFNRWSNITNVMLSFFIRPKFCYISDFPEDKSRSIITETIKRTLLYKSTALLAMSESTKRYYENLYHCCKSKTYVFPYTFSKINNEHELWQYNLNRNAKLIDGRTNIKLFLSNRFIERKGYAVVYQAFKFLKNNGVLDKFEISIAGSGPLYDEIKSLFLSLSDNITFLGWIEVDEYIRRIEECDVFLHASLLEPFGIPPLDAMSRGKLYIGSDQVKSTDTIIENGVNGFLYPSKDANTLASILSSIYNNPELIYKVGNNGKTTVRNTYGGEVIRMALDRVFNTK